MSTAADSDHIEQWLQAAFGGLYLNIRPLFSLFRDKMWENIRKIEEMQKDMEKWESEMGIRKNKKKWKKMKKIEK